MFKPLVFSVLLAIFPMALFAEEKSEPTPRPNPPVHSSAKKRSVIKKMSVVVAAVKGAVVAPQRVEQQDPSGYFYLEAAPGFDVPAQNWQSGYGSGFGGKIALGCLLDAHLGFQLDLENFYFSGTNIYGSISDAELIVLPTLLYKFTGHGFGPYISAGVGAQWEFLSAPMGSTSVVNLDAVLGAGLEYQWEDQTALFVEGKYNFVFASHVTGQDVPLLFGLRLRI